MSTTIVAVYIILGKELMYGKQNKDQVHVMG